MLFSCHINDLPAVLQHCTVQMYADDVQLYVSRRNPCGQELIGMMNEDLGRIHEWSTRNQLRVNQSKSSAMFIRNRRAPADRLDSLPPITMDGCTIQWTDSARNLGFIFQSDLQWDSLIAQQCGKVYASLRSLYVTTTTAPITTRLKLFKALILPHFMFGELLYIKPTSAAMSKLKVALNSCVRYVFSLNRYAHVSHLQHHLTGCSLENFYAYRACLFMRKLITRRSPPALHQKLISSQGRRLQNLVIPANSTTTYSNSFFVRGVVYWNMLPTTVKRSRSDAVFKRGCQQFWNR